MGRHPWWRQGVSSTVKVVGYVVAVVTSLSVPTHHIGYCSCINSKHGQHNYIGVDNDTLNSHSAQVFPHCCYARSFNQAETQPFQAKTIC